MQKDEEEVRFSFSVKKITDTARKNWLMVLCVLLIFLMMLWFNFNTAKIIEFQSKQCNEHWKNQLKEKCPHLVWQPYDWLADVNATDVLEKQEGG